MTSTTENQTTEEAERGSLSDTELKNHINEVKIFRLLLDLQRNPEEVMEHAPEDCVVDTYNSGLLIDQGEACGCGKDTLLSILRDFSQKNYISSPDGKIDWKQLSEGKTNAKIEINLNEPKVLKALLDDFIFLGEHIAKLTISSQQAQKSLASYEDNVNRVNEISKKYQDINDLYCRVTSLVNEWENTYKTEQENWKKQAETLKTEVEKNAEEVGEQARKTAVEEATKAAETKATETAETKAAETTEAAKKEVNTKIEEELKLSGKIGSAMHDMQKDIIQYMGIFIAIFALIGLNLNHAESWTISDFFHMNLIITASMATLLFLISILLNGKEDKGFRKRFMGIAAVLLWVIAILVHYILPILMYKI